MNKRLSRILVLAGVLLSAGGIMTRTHAGDAAASQRVDLLITHGKLLDGSGAEPRAGDIGIRGDRIVFIGEAAARFPAWLPTVSTTSPR